MRTGHETCTRRSHGECAGYVHLSLSGCQPRLTGRRPRPDECRLHCQTPVWRKGVCENVGLIVAPFALPPRGQWNGHQACSLTHDVARPRQSRHLDRHAVRQTRPAVVLEGMHEATGDRMARNPRHRSHGAHVRRQRVAPATGVAGLAASGDRMSASPALWMRKPRQPTPAKWTGRPRCASERRIARRADTGKRKLEHGARNAPPTLPERRASHTPRARPAPGVTLRHMTSRSGCTSPNQRCHERAPCAISMRSPSSARRPCARASATNGVGPERR